jgi:hypothetical protein
VSQPIKKCKIPHFCSRLIGVLYIPSLPTLAEHGYNAPFFPLSLTLSSLEIAGPGRFKLASKGGQEWAQTKRQQKSMVILPFLYDGVSYWKL